RAGCPPLQLRKFRGKPAPPAAAALAWPRIDKKSADADPFAYLNFVLTLCPPTGAAAVEVPMRARFAKIGVEAGKPFAVSKLTPAQKKDIEMAMKRGLEKIKQTVADLGRDENGWHVGTKGFGDRQAYAGVLTLRAAAAMAGIYGNDAVEALYPMLAKDSDGQRPDTSTKRYTLTFPAGQLPPANAFWSVTMYNRKTQL